MKITLLKIVINEQTNKGVCVGLLMSVKISVERYCIGLIVSTTVIDSSMLTIMVCNLACYIFSLGSPSDQYWDHLYF